ncbi:acetyltransferase [Anaeramoeba flamelloides]|uniref:Acetyltransferase n=1 Tax=Anaeramoeba flamelloides TaxID=1746091 RepID=A0AAV7Z5W0_9EUKA|nr:acetyltransferase [Anaeramoeba flamelloides]
MKKSEYFLTTKRIGFRLWSLNDLDLAVGLWGDPKVTKLIDSRGTLTEKDVKKRLEQEITMESKHGIQYWPIFLLESGEHIGCAGLRPYKADQTFEIGFHICSRFWRKGYAFEAATALIDHAFNTIGIQSLFAGHNPKNSASKNLLLKLGFTYTHDEYYEPTGLDHPSYLLTREL